MCILLRYEMRQHASPVTSFPRARVGGFHKKHSTIFCQFEALNQPHPTKVRALVVPFPVTAKCGELDRSSCKHGGV